MSFYGATGCPALGKGAVSSWILIGGLVCGLDAGLAADQPFKVSARLEAKAGMELELVVAVDLPPQHQLYADRFKVEVQAPVRLAPRQMPVAENLSDPATGEVQAFISRSFTAVFAVSNFHVPPLKVTVGYQGCGPSVCYLPRAEMFALSITNARGPPTETKAVSARAAAAADWRTEIRNFSVAAPRAGYLSPPALLAFLDAAEAGKAGDRLGAENPLTRGSIWLTLGLILLGGLALNLTPCVLPMIPINLAVIGAGARSGSRRRGFGLGALYGAGIALAYGALGLLVLLTGATFGAINASPWFNLGVALVFAVLALAMFDVFFIDLSRFQGCFAGAAAGGNGVTIFILGAVSAVLAGACVAPVVISVLIYSATLYAGGNWAGLALPFVLGVGMSLPWPFVGAGLALLPKPGQWMNLVKRAFGVIIVIVAVFYAVEGVKLMRRHSARAQEQALSSALVAAMKEHRPVFIDFGASWCKTCRAMETTTFKDPAVQERLRQFVCVKYQAEQPDQPPAKSTLAEFGVLGLPAYVVLIPK